MRRHTKVKDRTPKMKFCHCEDSNLLARSSCSANSKRCAASRSAISKRRAASRSEVSNRLSKATLSQHALYRTTTRIALQILGLVKASLRHLSASEKRALPRATAYKMYSTSMRQAYREGALSTSRRSGLSSQAFSVFQTGEKRQLFPISDSKVGR